MFCLAWLVGCGADDQTPTVSFSSSPSLDAGAPSRLAQDPNDGGAPLIIMPTSFVSGTSDDTASRAAVAGALRIVGRVDTSDPGSARFSWTGAGFIGTFLGPEVAFVLRTEDTDVVYFQTVVDDVPGQRFEVESGADRVITVASGLSAGPHEVAVYRDTEGMYGMSAFLGLSSGTLVGAPPDNGRFIEVIGDSIAAGFGDLGSDPEGDTTSECAVSVDRSDSSWFTTFGAVAGHALNAEVSTIAQEAWGLYRGATGKSQETLPAIYDDLFGSETTLKYAFRRRASAVIIDLGTNDWRLSDPGEPFETAYGKFLDHLRSVYPDAWIVMSIGSMLDPGRRAQVMTRLNHVLATRNAQGDLRISTLDLGTQDPAVTGCLGHPSVTEHRRMAALLQAELSMRLSW